MDGGGFVRTMKQGDWNCGNCNAHNFASRDYCFKCNISRVKEIGMGLGADEREGVWIYEIFWDYEFNFDDNLKIVCYKNYKLFAMEFFYVIFMVSI